MSRAEGRSLQAVAATNLFQVVAAWKSGERWKKDLLGRWTRMERGLVRGDCLRLPGDIHGERARWRCRGWRPRYALRISVHWAIRRRVPRLGKPARARRSSRDRSDEGLVFVISRAALLFNRSKRAASEELRPLQTMLPYSIPGLMLNA